MAVTGNTSTEIGDVMLFQTALPQVGVQTLVSYTDVTTGETGTRLFTKEFAYSTDGINFSDWELLTNPNIAAIPVSYNDFFFTKFRYTRAGIDATGDLTFDSVELTGTSLVPPNGAAYDNSVFVNYFDSLDDGVLTWALNVLNKLYAEGIIPKHIERGIAPAQDGDYIDFWKPLTLFSAYLVHLARTFETFIGNDKILAKFLEDRDVYLCGDEELADLQYIAQNYYKEISKRGTLELIEEGGTVDGELLRLVCKQTTEFFSLVYNQPKYVGLNVGNSSPLSKSVSGNEGFDLSYEAGSDVVADLSLYPIIGAPSIVSDRISGSAVFGIGANEADKRILVEPNLNFEISFSVIGSDVNIDLHFGILAFNAGGGAVTIENAITGASTNDFFTAIDLEQASLDYTVRGIIFNKDEANKAGSTTNLNVGNNLRFTSDVAYIIPVITINATSGSIAKLRVQPSSLPYAKTYINARHFTDIIFRNSNGQMTDAEIRAAMREDLIPANSGFQITETT